MNLTYWINLNKNLKIYINTPKNIKIVFLLFGNIRLIINGFMINCGAQRDSIKGWKLIFYSNVGL